MTLGRQMQHGINPGHRLRHSLAIADVASHEVIASGMLRLDPRQIIEIPGIRQGIKVDHLICGLAHKQAHEIAPDKPCTPRYKKLLHVQSLCPLPMHVAYVGFVPRSPTKSE